MTTPKLLFLCFLVVVYITARRIFGNDNLELALDGRNRLKRNVEDVTNINDVMDAMMPKLKQQILHWNLDPLQVSELEVKNLKNCQLTGIATIFRAGNSRLFRVLQPDGKDKYRVEADVGFSHINGTCEIRKKVLFLSYWGTLTMNTINVTAYLHLSIDIEENSHPVVDAARVDVPWDVQLQAHGEGSLSFFVETFVRLLRRRMRFILESALQQQMRTMLGEYLRRLTLRDVNNFIAQSQINATNI